MGSRGIDSTGKKQQPRMGEVALPAVGDGNEPAPRLEADPAPPRDAAADRGEALTPEMTREMFYGILSCRILSTERQKHLEIRRQLKSPRSSFFATRRGAQGRPFSSSDLLAYY
jgi:hypothetical protein